MYSIKKLIGNFVYQCLGDFRDLGIKEVCLKFA